MNLSQGVNFKSQNTQGQRNDLQTSFLSELHSGRTHIATLQEAGNISGANLTPVRGTPNLFSTEISGSNHTRNTRRSNQKSVHGLFYKFKGSKGKNARTSMAMLSSEMPLKSGIIKSRHKGVRPMMFMHFKNLTVTNLHLPSGKDRFAAKVLHGFLQDLDAEIGLQNRQKKGLLLLGDLNMGSQRATKTANPHGFEVHSPMTASHQGGGILDHAMTRNGKVAKLALNFNSSDHGSLSGVFHNDKYTKR